LEKEKFEEKRLALEKADKVERQLKKEQLEGEDKPRKK